MRNFDISSSSLLNRDSREESEVLEVTRVNSNGSNSSVQIENASIADFDRIQVFGDLSPEALSYIQHLQSELHMVEEVSSALQVLSFSCFFRSNSVPLCRGFIGAL